MKEPLKPGIDDARRFFKTLDQAEKEAKMGGPGIATTTIRRNVVRITYKGPVENPIVEIVDTDQ
jgi:hypothetical protein